MNKTVLNVFVLVAAIAMSASSFAQAAGPKNGQQGQKTNQARQGDGMMRRGGEEFKQLHTKILTELKLTADQKNKVTALDKKREDDQKKMMAEFTKVGRDASEAQRTQMRDKMRKMQEEYRAGLKKILGDAKYATYEKRMKEEMTKLMEKMRKERGQGGNGAGKTTDGKAGGKTTDGKSGGKTGGKSGGVN
ncbi:hypothetical protein QPK87_18645 [Kamptonema cortianum]|nr:hypothetical protein [Geitlerinema splendidum]MDK3158575.1 hypothetical protein [Kamptonema cortianum]